MAVFGLNFGTYLYKILCVVCLLVLNSIDFFVFSLSVLKFIQIFCGVSDVTELYKLLSVVCLPLQNFTHCCVWSYFRY